MTKTSSKLDLDQSNTVIIESEWAEEMFVHGFLKLTPEQIDHISNNAEVSLTMDQYDLCHQNMKNKYPAEWIDPLDAVHLLAPYTGGDAGAKSAIAERLRDCKIECCMLWISTGTDDGPVSNVRPNISDGMRMDTVFDVSSAAKFPRLLTMGGDFWAHSDDWERDVKRWDWFRGLFVVSAKEPYLVVRDNKNNFHSARYRHVRKVVSRIKFSLTDIEKLLDSRRPVDLSEPRADFDAKLQKKVASNKGRTRDPRWEDWTAEVVLAAYVKDLEWSDKQDEFYHQIDEMLENRKAERFGKPTLQRMMAAIKRRLTEATVSGEIELRSPK